jgi:putative PIN family toxin of toxin-antitoxin system
MIRVVIDTNVLASGIFWNGTPARVLSSWRKRKFQWLVSPEIMEEYQRTLGKLSLEFPGVSITQVLQTIDLHCEMNKHQASSRCLQRPG